MVLFALAGYAGYAFLGMKVLFPVALLAGLLVAPLVPVKTACAVKPPPEEAETPEPTEIR